MSGRIFTIRSQRVILDAGPARLALLKPAASFGEVPARLFDRQRSV